MQETRNSSALVMELRLSCTKPSIFSILFCPRKQAIDAYGVPIVSILDKTDQVMIQTEEET